MWVLIVVGSIYYGHGVYMQEFTTQESCEAARIEVLKMKRDRYYMEAVCVRK